MPKIILDLPSDAPSLGFPEYADALANIIMNSDARFAIGIFGDWGSGKTTLMRAIRTRLPGDSAICVDFSAWRYEKEEHLIVPLLDAVRAAIDDWAATQPQEVKERAWAVASVVGRAAKSVLSGLSLKVGLPGAMELSLDANRALQAAQDLDAGREDALVPKSFYHGSYRALQDEFTSFAADDPRRRIVVFVDDLDRCLPAGALEVLESMKLFFDLPGFVFVVGLDRTVIEWCIDCRYQREQPAGVEMPAELRDKLKGATYIDKFFQVPFRLPPVSPANVENFLNSMYLDARLPVEQQSEIENIVKPHLAFVVTDAGVNPRHLKQYVNAYTLQRMVRPNLNCNVVLALQTIASRPDWTRCNSAILSYHEVFTDAVSRLLQGDANAVEDLDPDVSAVPDEFIDYVKGPAAALLTETELWRYVFTGEATRSTYGVSLLQLINSVGRLVAKVGAVPGNGSAADQPRRTAAVDELRKEIDGLGQQLRSYAFGTGITSSWSALESMPNLPPVDMKPWVETMKQRVRDVLRELLTYYKAGAIGIGAGSSTR